MITLDVQKYCHHCLDFEADVEKGKKVLVGHDFVGYEASFVSPTIIRCAHRNRCKAIKRYLEKETQNEEQNAESDRD